MTGLLLLPLVGGWLWLSWFVARGLMHALRARPWRWALVPLVFAAQVSLPVADEIVGGFQFRALCAKNADFRMGVQDPAGRVARVTIDPLNQPVPDTAITILHSGFKYTDVQTDEVIVAFDQYVASGGALIQTLGISESNSPLTIGRPWCSPEEGVAVSHSMKFTVADRERKAPSADRVIITR